MQNLENCPTLIYMPHFVINDFVTPAAFCNKIDAFYNKKAAAFCNKRFTNMLTAMCQILGTDLNFQGKQK